MPPLTAPLPLHAQDPLTSPAVGAPSIAIDRSSDGVGGVAPSAAAAAASVVDRATGDGGQYDTQLVPSMLRVAARAHLGLSLDTSAYKPLVRSRPPLRVVSIEEVARRSTPSRPRPPCALHRRFPAGFPSQVCLFVQELALRVVNPQNLTVHAVMVEIEHWLLAFDRSPGTVRMLGPNEAYIGWILDAAIDSVSSS